MVFTGWIRAEVSKKIYHHGLLSYQGLLILPWREEDDKKKLTIIRWHYRVAWAAYYNDRVYEGCTRSVLQALQSHLHLENGAAIKASTALAGGVARMGETCGALTGGIMAIGLMLGREELENIQAYRDSMQASYEMYNRFREEMGSSICFEIHKRLLGRSFDFKIDEEAEEWYKAGGLEKCPMVCAIAARIAADIILRLKA
jgi:C_GCAxxG_C_C family probable redox protein